jgi:hypothetical protein
MAHKAENGACIQLFEPAPIFASRLAFFTKIDIRKDSVKENISTAKDMFPEIQV